MMDFQMLSVLIVRINYDSRMALWNSVEGLNLNYNHFLLTAK